MRKIAGPEAEDRLDPGDEDERDRRDGDGELEDARERDHRHARGDGVPLDRSTHDRVSLLTACGVSASTRRLTEGLVRFPRSGGRAEIHLTPPHDGLTEWTGTPIGVLQVRGGTSRGEVLTGGKAAAAAPASLRPAFPRLDDAEGAFPARGCTKQRPRVGKEEGMKRILRFKKRTWCRPRRRRRRGRHGVGWRVRVLDELDRHRYCDGWYRCRQPRASRFGQRPDVSGRPRQTVSFIKTIHGTQPVGVEHPSRGRRRISDGSRPNERGPTSSPDAAVRTGRRRTSDGRRLCRQPATDGDIAPNAIAQVLAATERPLHEQPRLEPGRLQERVPDAEPHVELASNKVEGRLPAAPPHQSHSHQ